MYRNCYYDRKESKIHEFTWDEYGDRIEIIEDFTPFVFIETSAETKYKSVYGTNLEVMKFDKFYQKNNFVNKYNGRIFYDISPEQQYLIKKYRKSDQNKFTENDIRIFYLDIECPSPDKFPDPDHADYEIDVMTIYDSLTDKFIMWGKHAYSRDNIIDEVNKLGGKIISIKKEDVIYHHIEDEKERLEHVLAYWKANTPDIYTHWNGDGFDTPYLINRIKRIVGGDKWKAISPVNSIRDVSGFDKYGNVQNSYKINGLSSMDYMEVFKIFTAKERESWSLDSVAQDVLNCGKIAYESSNLYQLSIDDWETYCAYNLVDVLLLRSIEKERRYLKLSRQTAYYGLSNPSDSLGKVKNIAGYSTLMGLKNGVVTHTDFKKEPDEIAGGFVRKPTPSFRKNVGSFDIKSLYPVIMIAFNMSTETKVGRVEEINDTYRVIFKDGGGKMFNDKSSYEEWIKDNKYCVSFHNIIFDQKKEGILTKIVKEQFAKKEEYGRLKKEAIKAGNHELAVEYEDLRSITKIFVNSVYGILSTPSSPYYDPEIANSITLTGQNIIKYSADLIEEYSEEKFKANGGIVVAGDTDSVMCDFTQVFDFIGRGMFNEDMTLSKTGDLICGIYSKMLNTKVNKMLREDKFCAEPDIIFEREKACLSALFFGKKQYAYYVLNNEGVNLDEGSRMKYTGLKVIKSEYSPFVKDIMNEMYLGVLSKYLEFGDTKCKNHVSSILKEAKSKFYTGGFSDISKRQKANKIKQYEDEYIDTFKAGSRCPAQVSSAINCNRLITKLGLNSKYPEHTSGSKPMWAYVKPNIHQIEKISGVEGCLPEEFGLEVDYDVQFSKMIMPVVIQLYSVMGWELPSFNFEEDFNIDEFWE